MTRIPNRVLIEPTTTQVDTQLVDIHTDYHYMHPAQVSAEHQQVWPPVPVELEDPPDDEDDEEVQES